MTEVQKVIKYMAIALAIILIVSIVSGVISFFLGMGLIFNIGSKDVIGETTGMTFEQEEVSRLDIKIAASNLTIRKGDKLHATTNNKNIEINQRNNKIEIKEKGVNRWYSKNNGSELTIYIPEDVLLNEVEIEAGAGRINIEDIKTEKFDLQLGAGETVINNIEVKRECEINGGAGKIEIKSSLLYNLDLDLGIGETIIQAKLIGNSDIDAGVGNLNLNLQGEKEEYKIRAEKGVGTIKIDNEDVKNNTVYGEGQNFVKIDGGVGNIKINFENI